MRAVHRGSAGELLLAPIAAGVGELDGRDVPCGEGHHVRLGGAEGRGGRGGTRELASGQELRSKVRRLAVLRTKLQREACIKSFQEGFRFHYTFV